MKATKYVIYIIALIAISCNDFLDHKPSKTTSIVPETTEHLEYLLNNYSNFQQELNEAVVYGSDDYGLYREIYDARHSIYSSIILMAATWDVEYRPVQTTDLAWSQGYSNIFRANMVLDYLSRVSGDEQIKKRLKAEAHLLRAYSFWYLVNTYSLPYTEANKNEPGVVLKYTTSFEEPMVRATLEETYEMIEDDLKEAIKIDVGLTTVNGKYKMWRGSKPAAYGFAARYYLFRNNYAEALKYADYALAEHDALVDYNTEMSFYEIKDEIKINSGTAEEQTIEIAYPYTYISNTDLTVVLQWKELYYLRIMQEGTNWFIPSRELLALYNPDYDLRYKYHYVPNYSYTRGVTSPAYSYPGYVFFNNGNGIPSGPTTAEMILIKAECQARQGDYVQAMNTVNTLRVKRMSVEAPDEVIHLTASSKDEAIRKILEERRREMPFSMRWFDIRRLNSNEDAHDDVGELKREFYPFNNSSILDGDLIETYILPKNSRQYAQPLLNTEIERSEGGIKQNTY